MPKKITPQALQKLFLLITGEDTEEEEQKDEDNPIDLDSLMTETEERN